MKKIKLNLKYMKLNREGFYEALQNEQILHIKPEQDIREVIRKALNIIKEMFDKDDIIRVSIEIEEGKYILKDGIDEIRHETFPIHIRAMKDKYNKYQDVIIVRDNNNFTEKRDDDLIISHIKFE